MNVPPEEKKPYIATLKHEIIIMLMEKLECENRDYSIQRKLLFNVIEQSKIQCKEQFHRCLNQKVIFSGHIRTMKDSMQIEKLLSFLGGPPKV